MKVFFSLLLLGFVASEKARFDNYTLYKVLPQNEQDLSTLVNLQNSDAGFDFWTDPSPFSDFVNILASPEKKATLESFLAYNDIKFQISLENLQEAIDKESVRTYTRSSRSMSWDAYYTLSDIESWMLDLAAEYSDIVTPVIGGFTYEGRNIHGLKISHGEGKKVIFIESGIHAREWISPSFACYIINELLTSQDAETMAAARDFEWYIFPVTNPDGYVWTHESFRLWRKNRRPVGTQFGIDLNRNWNSNWLLEGTSTNPAAETYPGLGPFSEPESRSMSEFIRSIGDNMEMYLSFHSYSQLLLLPYGNTTEPLDNYDEAINVGRRAMGALSARYGTNYVTGNVAEAIYHATGSSTDWVKSYLRVPLVYCYELRDRGQYGFVLPTDQILPNHLEAMDSLIEMIHQGKRFGLLNSASNVYVSFAVIVFALTSVWLF